MNLHLILLIIAVILFGIAALGVTNSRISLTDLGLAFLAAAFIF